MPRRKVYLFGIGSPDWMRQAGQRSVASIPGVRQSKEYAEAFLSGKPKKKRRRRRRSR